MNKIIFKYKILDDTLKNKFKFSIYELVLICGCLFSAVLMYVRVFYGTELTDEAHYISDALGMLHGNIPYAYNNFSFGTGAAFLLIPQLFIYEIFVPGLKGVFLFTRLSYVTFRLLIIFYSYLVLKKSVKRSHALLVTGFMIPFYGSIIQNYSYNTIPTMMSFLSGMLIYDALEHAGSRSKFKLYLAGFSTGIAVFAHPGYGVTLFIFLPLLLLRSVKKLRIKNLAAYCLGGITEILAVFVPIIAQAGLSTLITGLEFYIHPYPHEAMSPITGMERIILLLIPTIPVILIALITFVFIEFLSVRYLRENEKRLKTICTIQLGISAGIFMNILWAVRSGTGIYQISMIGVMAAGYTCVYAAKRKLITHSLFYYIALYPVLFSIAEILAVDSDSIHYRFYYALPALYILLLLALENESELVRVVTTITAVMVILIMGYSDYRYMYRDEPILELDYKVSDGVYAGIYTTQTRAADLPELEKYLNSAVKEGEYFAFRDNVPCGYLMTHNGMMCDVATWDQLQYSYRRNTPSELFAYYKRRNAIPDKIIYVDYGRDEKLSIEDNSFRYNDFVNAYYTLIDDVRLNNTFNHVMVYEYNGQFNGDYDYWINTYMEIPDTDKNEGK